MPWLFLLQLAYLLLNGRLARFDNVFVRAHHAQCSARLGNCISR